LVLKAKVHAANIMDWDGIKMLLCRADVQFPRLKHLWLDRALTEERTRAKIGWRRFSRVERGARPASAQACSKRGLEVVGRAVAQSGSAGRLGETIATERISGVAETVGGGTDVFLDQNRRMSKDYERLTEASEAFIYVAMSRLMARRLAR
jgi:putative transposase